MEKNIELICDVQPISCMIALLRRKGRGKRSRKEERKEKEERLKKKKLVDLDSYRLAG